MFVKTSDRDLAFKPLAGLSTIKRSIYSGTFYNEEDMSAISLCDTIELLLKSYVKLGIWHINLLTLRKTPSIVFANCSEFLCA